MDPIIDLIIRIKNKYMVHDDTVEVDHSTYKEQVTKKLKELNFIKDFKVVGDIKKKIIISLKYDEGVPALTGLKIHSKPGARAYTSNTKIKPVLGGMGQTIISSSKGIVTGKEAQKLKVGGELLFEIW